MKERPILFSGPMVRAILEDRKSQTRRVLNPQPQASWMENADWSRYYDRVASGSLMKRLWIMHPEDHHKEIACPYGAPGDQLWVREGFCLAIFGKGHLVGYRATDSHLFGGDLGDGTKWKPSIFMPRDLSRITLQITTVRVERLQDITDDDCDAEGFGGFYPHRPSCSAEIVTETPKDCSCPNYSLPEIFSERWDVLNAKRGFGWDVNPWVWVIEFRRVTHG